MSAAAHQRITITSDDVRAWVIERDRLMVLVKDLNRKIDAATVFLPHAVSDPQSMAEGGAMTLGDWIERVVTESDVALQPKDIRLRVEAKGVEVAGENYIYTAIKRLTDRGKILKTYAGYVPANSSSKEETPDHKAGGDLGLFTPEGGAVGAVPEAGGT